MHRSVRGRFGVLGAALGLGAGLLVAIAPAGSADSAAPTTFGHLSSGEIASLSAHADQPVIVIFKDQVSSLPETKALTPLRVRAVAATEGPVLHELHQLRAADLHTYTLLDAVSAKVSGAEEARLAADPAVAEVVPDQTTQLSFTAPATSAAAAPLATGTGSDSPTSACQPGKDGVELDPQALEAIHADSDLPGSGPTAASLGITGAGVKVAFIAEGFHTDQPNFIRSDGSKVFVDEKDFTGEGIGNDSGGEASLDASSIAAQGNVEYTAELTDGKKCTFNVLGAAPGVSLVGLKVFSNNYLATTTSILEAIDYAVGTDHVNVLNESFGYNPLPDTMTDVVRMADEAAVAAGTVVDVSTGDAGPTSTVGSPSTDPAVISAGASTTYRVYAQEQITPSGVGFKGWEDDNLSGLSSAGFTEGLKGPNLIAPGDLNWVSANPQKGVYEASISGGTSEAAPLTSATAALVIQAYGKTHGGAVPSPALVKEIITSTATDLGLPADQQGAGLLNSYQAVLEAESIKTPAGSPTPTGSTLATNVDEISAAAPAATSVTSHVTVTNTGAETQTVALAGRILSKPTVLASTTFSDRKAVFQKKLTFTVPAGTSFLSAHAAVEGPPVSFVDIDLIDPLGRLAIDGLPQGYGDASNVGVRYPGAGTWTAYVTYQGDSRATSPLAFDAEAQTWQSFGTVTPASVKLAPGASQAVTVSVETPATAGDESAALQLTTPFGQPTSIPIALRALVPLDDGAGTFSAQVLGGNGRGGGPSDQQFFEVDVPKGKPDLIVSTAFADGPANEYSVYLVSPTGETLGHASNQLVVGGSAADPVTKPETGAVSHVLDPAPGVWTIIVAFANPASGTATSATLSGSVLLGPVPTTTHGVPTSSSTVIPVGTKRTISITVHNRSDVPQAFFLDPRLTKTATVTLTPLSSVTGLSLPLVDSAPVPQWIVPTDTTSLLGGAQATAPVTFDMSPYLGNFEGELNGDPQVTATTSGDAATATWSDTPVTPGVWNVDPALTGVFTNQGAPSATADLSLVAKTQGFNTAITTGYGDLWDGTGTVKPVIVQPGKAATLEAVIAPTTVGTANGTVYVDTVTSISPFGQPVPAGDQIAAVPYEYTASKS